MIGKVFELNQYIKECELDPDKFQKIDIELLANFIEAIFETKLRKKVVVTSKISMIPFDRRKYIISMKSEKGVVNLVTMFKTGFFDFNCNITANEVDAISQAFKKWCDIMQFDSERGYF